MGFWDFFWGKEVDFIVTLVASIYVLYYYSSAIYLIKSKEKDNSINTLAKEDFSKSNAYIYFVYALLTVPTYITDFGANYVGIMIIAITMIITIIAMILFKKLED